MIQEVVDGKDAEVLVTAVVEGKAEEPEEESVEENAKRRMETAGRFLDKRGVARQPIVIVVTQEGFYGRSNDCSEISRTYIYHKAFCRRYPGRD